jgi:hypothetical protein
MNLFTEVVLLKNIEGAITQLEFDKEKRNILDNI